MAQLVGLGCGLENAEAKFRPRYLSPLIILRENAFSDDKLYKLGRQGL